MISELVSGVALLMLSLSLYRLLGRVSKEQASLMVAFVVISVPITFLNALNNLAALELAHGASFLSIFNPGQTNALAMLFLDLHSLGIVVNAVLWGLWLLPFGTLVYESGFIPRVLGILLIVNGLDWLLGSFAILLSLPFANLPPLSYPFPSGNR
jgi:uncharacterized protein DUF4386